MSLLCGLLPRNLKGNTVAFDPRTFKLGDATVYERFGKKVEARLILCKLLDKMPCFDLRRDIPADGQEDDAGEDADDRGADRSSDLSLWLGFVHAPSSHR